MLIKDVKCPNCETYHDPTLRKCPSCHKNNELFALNRLPKRVLFLHPMAQVGLFLIGFSYIGMLIAEIIFALVLRGMPSDLLKTTLMLTLVYGAMFLGLCSIPLFTRRKELFDKYKSGIDYLYGLAYAITIICIGTVIGALVSLFYNSQDNVNQTVAIEISTGYPILAFFVLGFLGPICEELTYRVGLYSFLRRINKYLAFAVTIVIFALIHFEFMADDIVNELWSLPSYIISGFLLTLAYEHRGPACSMTAHITYNIFAFILILVQNNG